MSLWALVWAALALCALDTARAQCVFEPCETCVTSKVNCRYCYNVAIRVGSCRSVAEGECSGTEIAYTKVDQCQLKPSPTTLFPIITTKTRECLRGFVCV